MNGSGKEFITKLMLLFLGLSSLCPTPAFAEKSVFHLERIIPLPGVKGRIDHMDIDREGERLFVAALGNNSLEVLDLKTGRVAESIKGLSEPQGVLYIQELNRLFVTNGGNGRCEVLDGRSLKHLAAIHFSEDADNIRYDSSTKKIYIGYGGGAIGVVDAPGDKRLGDIVLQAHPESFQLEASGSRIFVNVPEAGHLAVIDRTKESVTSTWPLGRAKGNFPMALDERNQRLFTGCRNPPKIIVYNSSTGRPVASMDVSEDIDDIFYDRDKNLVYASCGAGYLFVFRQDDPDRYTLVEKLPTAKGARTCLFVPEQRRMYLAVPSREGRQAEVHVYTVFP